MSSLFDFWRDRSGVQPSEVPEPLPRGLRLARRREARLGMCGADMVGRLAGVVVGNEVSEGRYNICMMHISPSPDPQDRGGLAVFLCRYGVET